MCQSGIFDATLRKSCILSESKRSLKGHHGKVRGCGSQQKCLANLERR
jgi:hypothetical protein